MIAKEFNCVLGWAKIVPCNPKGPVNSHGQFKHYGLLTHWFRRAQSSLGSEVHKKCALLSIAKFERFHEHFSSLRKLTICKNRFSFDWYHSWFSNFNELAVIGEKLESDWAFFQISSICYVTFQEKTFKIFKYEKASLEVNRLENGPFYLFSDFKPGSENTLLNISKNSIEPKVFSEPG